jgi:hypothetical protein
MEKKTQIILRVKNYVVILHPIKMKRAFYGTTRNII